MENTQTTQPITNINTEVIKRKQILVTFNDDNNIDLYCILNDLVNRGIIKQYETLDFYIETNTFNNLIINYGKGMEKDSRI